MEFSWVNLNYFYLKTNLKQKRSKKIFIINHLINNDGIVKISGKQIRITPTVDRLYPTVVTFRTDVEANFGDNLVAKPFKYDIGKGPGLVFE
jgi:hypothetical protein